MVLVLTRRDLKPLLEDGQRLDGAFDALAAGLQEDLAGTAKRFPNQEPPLTGPQKSLRVNLGSSPSMGFSFRSYPFLLRVNPNSHVNLLFDPEDGRLLALISGDELNMLRTAIPVGLAARYLAPANTRVLAMIGSGRQARGQARTIAHALPGLERIQVFSPTPDHREAYAHEMRATLRLPVEPKLTCQEAFDGADVIALVATTRAPVFEAEWVKPSALALSINSTQIPPALVLHAKVVLGHPVERLGQPYASLIEQGSWSMDQATSIAEILNGSRRARARTSDVVIAEMLGAGIWDVALLRWAYDWALAHEAGSTLNLSEA